MTITLRCGEVKELFKYLERLMDRLDDDWPALLQNIKKSRQVWGRLGKMLQREGADLAVLSNLYLPVIHAVLFFGEEN